MILLSTFIVVCLAGIASSANILAVFPALSFSHHIVYNNLMLELNKRGHNITIVTPNPIKDETLTNYTEIDASGAYTYKIQDLASDSMVSRLIRRMPGAFTLKNILNSNRICEFYLEHPQMVRIREEDQKFDLFMVEWTNLPCIYPYMKQSTGGSMGIMSTLLSPLLHYSLGSTANPAYVPNVVSGLSDHMTFEERFSNTLMMMYMQCWRWVARWNQDRIVGLYFPSGTPGVAELELSVDLVLTNTHFSASYPRPNNPNVIEIGGPPFHLIGKQPKPLPKDIQEFLDSATDGVIYFSLGSNVKSSTMPEAKRKLFLDAFRQLKQKVLWKWETDDLPDKPDNVKLGKWLPQTDILAHPNIRGFITQGGLQSMGEATHNSIPMVVIPFFADQELNAKKLVSVGVAIRLDFETLTTEQILDALREITTNPQYKENVQRYSALTKDQPQSPMERAVWWTEYVIRHKGARHLRSAAVNMPWYQYFLLDVIGFLLVTSLLFFYLTYLVTRTLFRLLFKSGAKSKEE